MEIEPKYTFLSLPQNNYFGLNDKATQELLTKWGLNENFHIQNFSFNEPFQPYHKYNLTESFFKDQAVAGVLKTKSKGCWAAHGTVASTVETRQIPCSVLTMSFFEKLKDPNNKVVHNSGTICKRYDLDIDGFLVSDNLRGMLIDEDCEQYNLYSKNEREEFIFRILQLLVLGGSLCQYEDTIEPYLKVTKNLYKDLIRVQKQKDSNELSVSTMVLEVVAKDANGRAYFPCDQSSMQNIGFLLVDRNFRQITTVLHQYS
ncbi:uncharacterized protein C11orf70 homolog [Cephus cinctus]|uniref:Cilia- and flagella-associated protein 300 n=1 Tax=Cephus cinctus TaxID=211228 RepID=A0AAJ7FEE8_CEPCN|nr:uncharacterized protein C11orf70 homolog [Cephus cinctus]